jgi:hypothetical protein
MVSGDRLRLVLGLREGLLATDRREVEVTCLRPGLSRNGNYYGPDCLRAAARLFEGARCYIDHADSSLRSVRDLAGQFREPRIADDGSVRATLRVSKAHDWLWELIRESVNEGSNLVGLSVDCTARTHLGEVAGKQCRIVEEIQTLQSVDVVTRAAAGGTFDALKEADRQSWWDQVEPANERAAELAARSAAGGVPVAQQQLPVEAGVVNPIQFGPGVAQDIPGGQIQLGGTYVADRPVMQGAPIATGEPPSTAHPMAPPPQITDRTQLSEGSAGVAPATAVAPYAAIRPQSEAPDALAEVRRLREEVERERALLASERLLEARLRETMLPQVALQRVRERFVGQVATSEAIATAIKEETDYLGAIVGDGRVTGLGYERGIRVGLTETEKLQKAFDQLFDIQEGELVPRLTGIREAYVVATRDVEVSGYTDPSRLQEADVQTSTFSYLLGTSMNKRLLKDYQAWPSEWQKFCTITPIKDFRQQDRIRLGAFGSLSTVAEDTAYTTITLSDTRAIYSPSKRGNLVAVTRETIVNDDLYAIKQIPGKLAVAAAFTLAEFVYALLAANGAAIYDTFKLFDSINHLNTGIITANLGTPGSGAALSTANLQTAVTKMRRQQNLASKPIGLKPRFLLVPPELEFAAMTIVKSAGVPGSNFNDINPMLGYAEVIVAPQLASPTYWAAIADPRVIDTIEVGFVGGQMNPQLFIQDQPLYGNNFTNDVITYKVRHEYGGAVVDYRGFYLGNN